jgi:hypothetical protein
MSYERMTSDDPTVRREEVVYRDPDTGTRTIIYVVAALIVLGLVYLAATAFWGTSDTATTAPVTIEQNDNPVLLPSEPDAMAPAAPEAIAPAPDAMAPAPDATAPAPDAGSLDATPAPSAPPVTEPATP